MPGRILIADTVPTNRITMKVMLNAACYDVFMAGSGEDVLAKAQSHLPDVIIIDSDIDAPGAQALVAALKANRDTAHIAVAVVGPDMAEPRLSAFRAGAEAYLEKPVDCVNLRARVRSLLRIAASGHELKRRQDTARSLGFAETPKRYDHPASICLVAAKVDEAMKWRAGLRGLINDTVDIQRRDMVLHAIQSGTPDELYVLSSDFTEGDDGLRLLSELRAREVTRNAAIVVRYPEGKHEQALVALDLGADDIIASDRDPEEFALRLSARIRRKREADRLRDTIDQSIHMASIDALTGLYNRRFALPHIENIAEEARSSGRGFALMLVDIDKFKAVNDVYGHAMGDEALVEVARRLRDNLRAGDMVARFGGEEFIVVLPDTDLTHARAIAERLRAEVVATPVFMSDGGDPVSVSISIGLAMCGNTDTGRAAVAPLIDIADTALYAAKAEGRNQVTLGSHAA